MRSEHRRTRRVLEAVIRGSFDELCRTQPRWGHVLRLRNEGHSMEDVARILGANVATCKTHARRGRLLLIDILARRARRAGLLDHERCPSEVYRRLYGIFLLTRVEPNSGIACSYERED
jgi:hypothetical protein